MSEPCAAHPGRPATHQCDGCGRRLCDDCIERGHRLLFCRHCRERALPLPGTPPPPERQRRQVAMRAYSLADALAYPLRGSGKLMFIIIVVSSIIVGWIARFGIGIKMLILVGAYWSLLVGLQFKIVRDTAKGEDELPDWPDYLDWGERLPDLFAWIVISIFNLGGAALWVFAGRERLLEGGMGLPFWAVCAALLWLGSALAAMAFGAAGVHGAGESLRVDRHLRGFFAGGADAVETVNLTFGLGALVLIVKAALDEVPFLGETVAGALGAYWTLVSAHLVGVLFRRRGAELAAVYEEVAR